MAFIVEDGTVIADANSYVSVTDADAYFLTHLYSSEFWDDLSTTQKENALMASTAFLDQTFDWSGQKTAEDSSLRWPRTGVTSVDDVIIGENEIPNNLKKAVCEQAVALQTSDVLAESGAVGIEELKVDVIELKFDKTDKAAAINSKTSLFLRGLGTSVLGSRVVKVYRS